LKSDFFFFFFFNYYMRIFLIFSTLSPQREEGRVWKGHCKGK
jgi:hypothetical protein